MDKKIGYDDLKDIDEKTYLWSVNVLRSVIKMLKVKVKLHADNQALQGDIFLFNHFSRFETFIPQFLIFEETGAYSCSIASSEFFKSNSLFASYLDNVGVVPHDHPNLFTNLARQIFLGRKVIIFPEGGMVKDRRVIDAKGNYSIYSRIAGERRKQHTGAAVLAQGIETFKFAIRNAYIARNFNLLEQWKQQLKLESLEQLLITALKPTQIVPSNITFYPIRASENLLLKGVELFADGLSKRQMEELIVESNILLRDTDMDLRLGKAIDSQLAWPWWNRYILDQVVTEFNSFDEVFSIYTRPKSWKQKLLSESFRKNAKKTRNQYMVQIYANLTVNLSHLASCLIMYCMKSGLQQINKKNFFTSLYLAIKELQRNNSIYLHRSLLNPDEYNNLVTGHCKRFEHFICIAETSGLIISYQDDYKFLPKLLEQFDFDQIRMENLITVYNNEVEPLKLVRDIVLDAYEQSFHISKEQLAVKVFDDEIISLAWDQRRYEKIDDDINKQQRAKENHAPFLLEPNTPNGIGILLIHGLLASPAELRDYANVLLDHGYTVLAVRLKGHGTSPHDLRKRTVSDWYQSVQRGLDIINAYCESIVVIGFSTGGGLALKLAAESNEKLVAVVAVAVPVKFVSKSFLFVPLLHGTNRLVKWVSSMEGVKPFLENNPEHPSINYVDVPVKSLYELRCLIDDVELQLTQIKIPTLVIYADSDPVVHVDSADIIMKNLGATYKEVIFVKSDRHGILMENIGGTWDAINSFLKKTVLNQSNNS